MSNIDVIRAWKDEEYRRGLSEEQRAMLPGNPAGGLELSEVDLNTVYGGQDISMEVPVDEGAGTLFPCTLFPCTLFPCTLFPCTLWPC